MANLKEVRSQTGELLYYVEVEESTTKKKRNKASVEVTSKSKSKSKSKSRFPFVDMPPKTFKGKGDKLVYPKWLYDVQRRAYSEAMSEGKDWTESNYRGMLALVEAWNAKIKEDGDVSIPPKV